jgi:hypothetical protein
VPVHLTFDELKLVGFHLTIGPRLSDCRVHRALVVGDAGRERGDEAPPAHEELSLRVFVKNDGNWQVAAFHNTMIAPFTPPVR